MCNKITYKKNLWFKAVVLKKALIILADFIIW